MNRLLILISPKRHKMVGSHCAQFQLKTWYPLINYRSLINKKSFPLKELHWIESQPERNQNWGVFFDGIKRFPFFAEWWLAGPESLLFHSLQHLDGPQL